MWKWFYKCILQICILIHWGRVTHICVSKLTIIGSDNGLSPDRCQAIIWINAGILLIGPLGTNFSETKFIHFHSRKCMQKYRLKMAAILPRPHCVKHFLCNWSPRGVPHNSTDDKASLVQVMAWCLISAKLLPLSMKPIVNWIHMTKLHYTVN